MKDRTVDGEDGLHSTIDPSSSEAIDDDLGLEPKHKIFLSHSGAQKEFVDHLCSALEERCHFPFCDRRRKSLPKGEKFLGLLLKAVQQCELFVVVISEEYFMSKWPMIELNVFVKAMEEMKSSMNRGILPLFYGLSVSELKDEKRRQRFFEKWMTFARDDPKGLLKVDDWKYALDFLTKINGLSYNRELKQVEEYENDVVLSICTFVTPDISSLLWEAVTKFPRVSDTSLLTFPAGDPDPVRIEDKDLQSLQPRRHLSIRIVDFYLKYLEKEVLSIKDKDRFFFFNCTFGTKISSTGYEQAGQWIRGVNLFEKDYVFIPVYKSEHWSLIIICHLNSLTGSPTDVHNRSPCIFHLDSVEGKDDGLEGDIRSFIFKSWIEIHQKLDSTSYDIFQALFLMKYVETKVPQEDNGYDSGIYLLHYVELFILESASPDFSFGTEQGKSHFPGWDTSEVLAKRKHIQHLILRLSGRTLLQGTLILYSPDIFSWLRDKAASEGRIKDVQNSDLTVVNGKGAEREDGCHQTGGSTVLNEHQPFNHNLTLLREETRLRQEEETRLRQEEETRLRQEEETRLRLEEETRLLQLEELEELEELKRFHQVEETRLRQEEETRLLQLEEPRRLRQAEETLLPAGNDTPILREEWRKRRMRSPKWSTHETSVLLVSMVGYMKEFRLADYSIWEHISREVNRVCGTERSPRLCRYRYDTLIKAFKQVNKFCLANAKKFSEITEQERSTMKLSTTWTWECYTLMEQCFTYRADYRQRALDSPTSSAAEIHIEAPADRPSSPRMDTDSILSSSAGEFQSEILPEPPPASPNNRHDGTPVLESLVTTHPRPLVQLKRIRRHENEMIGVYRRVGKAADGSYRVRYEPRFKPPRDITLSGETVKYNSLALGGYNTQQDAIDVRQIAAYYYGRSVGRLELGDGAHFLIPDGDSVELQSLSGKEKAVWVTRRTKEVFTAFQMEKARRLKPGVGLFRKEDRQSPAIPNPETQKEPVELQATGDSSLEMESMSHTP